MYHDADVAGRDMVNNNRWGVAPTITFGLNSPTRVTLSYYHMQTDDLPDAAFRMPIRAPRSSATAATWA